MHPYLRQALTRHHDEFFAMSEEEQTLFKLQDHDKLDKKISKFVKNKMGIHKKYSKNTPEETLEYNTIMLPYMGIGPNSFMMNEFDWNEKILRFKNLYEANKANHTFQETSNVKDFDDYEAKDLYNRYNDWARAFVDGKFYYLNINSYAIWLYYTMNEISYNWLDKNIPHDYVSGKDDGKRTEGGTIWDMELTANGLEGWYEHMKTFAHECTNNHFNNDILENVFGDKVFLVDRETNDLTDPALTYVFGSIDVLKKITYLNFVEDCEKVSADSTELIDLKDKRTAEFEAALNDEYAAIKKTMKPDEVPEREKNTVIFADAALDDLNELDD